MNLTTLKIIWAALLSSQFIYGLALQYLISQNTSAPQTANSLTLPIISSLAMVIFFAAIFLPRYFLKNEKKQLHGQSTMEVLIPKFVAPFVIRLALFEAGALIGFCLAFMNRDINYFYPFAAISLTAYLLNFPSEQKIKDAFN